MFEERRDKTRSGEKGARPSSSSHAVLTYQGFTRNPSSLQCLQLKMRILTQIIARVYFIIASYCKSLLTKSAHHFCPSLYQSGNGWVGGIIKSDLPSWIMNSGANPSDFLPDIFSVLPKKMRRYPGCTRITLCLTLVIGTRRRGEIISRDTGARHREVCRGNCEGKRDPLRDVSKLYFSLSVSFSGAGFVLC